ncbi:T9SS type A sorting domain-containing protein [Lewinella sp. LCG006]|uniref:T9SS type A sorting domain-containing protein n=1 Tax=Lewinella sp. LCG006 TaxID=3231911 RepID=UPI003460A7F4
MRSFFFLFSCSLIFALQSQTLMPAGVPGAAFWRVTEPTEASGWHWVERVTPATEPIVFTLQQKHLLNHWPTPDWEQLDLPAPLLIPANQGTAFTLFMVTQMTQPTSEKVLWSWQQQDQAPLLCTNKRIADLQGLEYLNLSNSSPLVSLHTYQQSAQKASTNIPAYLRIGQLPPAVSVPAGEWSGALAEFLFFPRVLAPQQQRQVESYLALKYGLTLGEQGQGKDYLNRKGQIIWNAEKNKAFHHRIFGLGTDLQSGWKQVHSSTSLAPELVTISLSQAGTYNGQSDATGLPDQAYCIIGDNDAPLEWEVAPNLADGEKLLRNWLVQLSGDVRSQEMSLTIDLGRWLGDGFLAADYQLCIDRSGRGDFLATATEFIPLGQWSVGRFGHFNGVLWDTDGSGSDVFSLVRKNTDHLTISTPALRVYPNPMGKTTGWQWQLRLSASSPLTAQLNNAQGQVVWQRTYPAADYFAGNEAALPTGVYFLHLETSQETFTQKLMVQ